MTRRSNNHLHPTHPTVAKWCIWSVKNQTWLAGQIRIYIFGGCAVVALFTLAGIISLQTALCSLFISGVVIATAIWLLIRQRRIWLLNIKGPELRQQALGAMVGYLEEINHAIPWRPHDRPTAEHDHENHTDCSHSR